MFFVLFFVRREPSNTYLCVCLCLLCFVLNMFLFNMVLLNMVLSPIIHHLRWVYHQSFFYVKVSLICFVIFAYKNMFIWSIWLFFVIFCFIKTVFLLNFTLFPCFLQFVSSIETKLPKIFEQLIENIRYISYTKIYLLNRQPLKLQWLKDIFGTSF